MTLAVREVSRWEDAPGLEERWEELVLCNSTDTVFLSYPWLATWWRCFGSAGRLLVLLVEREGVPVAIAPLIVDDVRLLGRRATRLRFAANTQTLRMDLIALPEAREAAMSALADHLIRMDLDWHVLDLYPVPAASGNLRALEAELRARSLRIGRLDCVDSPYLTLRGNWEEQQRQLSRNLRRNVSRAKARLASDVDYRFVPFDETTDDRLLAKCFEVAEGSWQAQLGASSTVSSSAVREFYGELWRAAGQWGWRFGGMLEIGGEPAAFLYCLDHHGRVHCLKTGYDPARGEYSPGLILLALVLERACEEGKQELDLMGDADAWKLHWTKTTRPHVRLLAFNRTFRALAAYTTRCVVRPRLARVPGLRQLRAFGSKLLSRRSKPV